MRRVKRGLGLDALLPPMKARVLSELADKVREAVRARLTGKCSLCGSTRSAKNDRGVCADRDGCVRRIAAAERK